MLTARRFILKPLLIVLVLAPALAGAQKANDLKRGAQVAITDTHGKKIKGRYVGQSDDSISIRRLGAAPVSLDLRQVTTIKVRHASHVKGLLLGALIGAGVGAIGGGVMGGMDDSCGFFSCGRAQNAAFGASVIGVLGLGIGSVTGLIAGWPSWHDASDQAIR